MINSFFNANNKVGQVWSFKTNSPSGTTFSPYVGSSVLWDTGDGSSYVQNSLNYTYTDSGITKTVSLRGENNFIKNLKSFAADSDGLVGHIDLSGWDNLGNINPLALQVCHLQNNPDLTGVTHTESAYEIKGYRIDGSDITGLLDLSMIRLKSTFSANNNPNLTGITHSASTEPLNYNANNCDLTGNLDLSPINLSGNFRVNNNLNLTSITHSYSTETFINYDAYDCNLTGIHDVSMFPGLGGDFFVRNNVNLTEIIHTASTNALDYDASNTGISHLDVSMLSGLGGVFSGIFRLQNCPNLTGVTHTASTNVINSYHIYNCNLTGNHDVSMFPNLIGSFWVNGNANLTGITHTSNTGITSYQAQGCNLISTHDMSMINELGNCTLYNNSNLTRVIHTGSITPGNYSIFSSGLIGIHDMSMLSARTQYIRIHDNTGLTGVLLGPSTETFNNTGAAGAQKAISMNNCSLGYVDFWPLSAANMNIGATNGASIIISNNGMKIGDVNHILYDLDNMTILNQSGWSGVTLDISGTNAAPNGSAGGFDGTGATLNLIANGWTVTTS